MRTVIISDSHGGHGGIKIPKCDLLVHCGDCSSHGGLVDTIDFLKWFEKQPAPEKAFCAGNHDWLFEKEPGLARKLVAEHAPSARYLEDHGERIAGIHVWGSPYQPAFNNWAFNAERGEVIKKHWDKIPHGVDLLITHGPAHGILDQSKNHPDADHLGCEELAKCIKRIKPRVHAAGHIHGGYGLHAHDGILSVNASVMNENYDIVNSPVIINL